MLDGKLVTPTLVEVVVTFEMVVVDMIDADVDLLVGDTTAEDVEVIVELFCMEVVFNTAPQTAKLLLPTWRILCM